MIPGCQSQSPYSLLLHIWQSNCILHLTPRVEAYVQYLPHHIPALVRVWIVRVQLPHPFLPLLLVHLEGCFVERLHILDHDVLLHVTCLHDLIQFKSLVLSFISIVVSLLASTFLSGHFLHHLLKPGSTEHHQPSLRLARHFVHRFSAEPQHLDMVPFPSDPFIRGSPVGFLGKLGQDVGGVSTNLHKVVSRVQQSSSALDPPLSGPPALQRRWTVIAFLRRLNDRVVSPEPPHVFYHCVTRVLLIRPHDDSPFDLTAQHA